MEQSGDDDLSVGDTVEDDVALNQQIAAAREEVVPGFSKLGIVEECRSPRKDGLGIDCAALLPIVGVWRAARRARRCVPAV
jgi:hypothetical protein